MNKARFFGSLHPVCVFTYFVLVLALTLACFHPVMAAVSLSGAVLFYSRLGGWRKVAGHMKFAGPMFLIIALSNPLFNHRGVTCLFILFDQWITAEAVCYGLVSATSLTAVIFWFSCYQVVMTSDKFLYLFGKVAPGSALLITMTLRLIPQLGAQLKQIQECQEMLREPQKRIPQKIHTAIRHVSTLLTWSMENSVEMADSMKARGYGLRRRTTFHLFRFDSRDRRVLSLFLALGAVAGAARFAGHGAMEFYPRMTPVFTGQGGVAMYVCFLALAYMPFILEGKEAVKWRLYGLST